MINKKLLFLCFLMLFCFSTGFIYAEDKNFVTILNGASTTNGETIAYSFVGQPVVYNTQESKDYISKSAFASVLTSSQNQDIEFSNNTSSESFKDIDVPVSVTIKSTNGKNVTKVRYQVWQGTGYNWEDRNTSPEINWNVSSPSTTVEFSTTVVLSQGNTKNYFRVYAQLADGNSGRWSDAYEINLSSSLVETIKFTSPDPLMNTSSTDPLVETTEYSLNLTSATVSLYKGNSDLGIGIFSVEVSSTTNEYKMYDTQKGKISFTYSEFAKIYNDDPSHSSNPIPTTLTQNETYTLKIESVIGTDTVTFKALSGGVGELVPYPSPFNPKKEKVKIKYLLAKDSRVTIKLYDKAGKIVCKLLDNENKSAGTNEQEWDGRNYAGDTLATGAYIIEIIAKASDGEHRKYTAVAIVGK